jgi:hypothetical protein
MPDFEVVLALQLLPLSRQGAACKKTAGGEKTWKLTVDPMLQYFIILVPVGDIIILMKFVSYFNFFRANKLLHLCHQLATEFG